MTFPALDQYHAIREQERKSLKSHKRFFPPMYKDHNR